MQPNFGKLVPLGEKDYLPNQRKPRWLGNSAQSPQTINSSAENERCREASEVGGGQQELVTNLGR